MESFDFEQQGRELTDFVTWQALAEIDDAGIRQDEAREHMYEAAVQIRETDEHVLVIDALDEAIRAFVISTEAKLDAIDARNRLLNL